MPKLSRRFVAALKPVQRDTLYRDSALTGFFASEAVRRSDLGHSVPGRQRPHQTPQTGPSKTDKSRIERHNIPLLGKMAVVEVTPQTVRRFVHDVQTGKTAATRRARTGHRLNVTGGAWRSSSHRWVARKHHELHRASRHPNRQPDPGR
jgi:hypothetical protein